MWNTQEYSHKFTVFLHFPSIYILYLSINMRYILNCYHHQMHDTQYYSASFSQFDWSSKMPTLRSLTILLLLLFLHAQMVYSSKLSPTPSDNLLLHPQKITIDAKTTVTIINFEQNLGNLIFHCQSKDDDFGTKLLAPNGSWSFTFRPNFLIGGTLYYCYLNWTGDVKIRHFDIYDQGRDLEVCRKDCTWHIKQSGPCLQVTPETCYPWKSNVTK